MSQSTSSITNTSSSNNSSDCNNKSALRSMQDTFVREIEEEGEGARKESSPIAIPSIPNRRLPSRHQEALNKALASGYYSLKDYIQTHRILGIPFVLDDAIIACPAPQTGAQRLKFWKKLLTTNNFARSSDTITNNVGESRSNFISKQLSTMYEAEANSSADDSLTNIGQEISNTTLGSLGSNLSSIQVKTSISLEEFSKLVDMVDNVPLSELEKRHGTIFGEIERDITRTFRGSDLFSRNSQGERSIGRILRALALKLPEVGYCQGMNFVAASFLLTRLPPCITLAEEKEAEDEKKVEVDVEEMGVEGQEKEVEKAETDTSDSFGGTSGDLSDEVTTTKNDFPLSAEELRQIEFEVFELMVILMDKNSKFRMSSLWRPGVPNIKLRVYQFDRLLHLHFPKLHAHFDELNLAPEILVSQWFITLFSYSFHWLSTGRLWDYIFYGGFPALFRVCLAMLALLENEMLQYDLEGVSNLLKDWKFGSKKNIDNSITKSFEATERANCYNYNNNNSSSSSSSSSGHFMSNTLKKNIRYYIYFSETLLHRARSIVVSNELLKSLQDNFSLEMVEMSQRFMQLSSPPPSLSPSNASSHSNSPSRGHISESSNSYHIHGGSYPSSGGFVSDLTDASPGKGFRSSVKSFVKDLFNINDTKSDDDDPASNSSFFDPPTKTDENLWLLRYGNRINAKLNIEVQSKLIEVKNQLLIIDKCVSIETEAIQAEIANVVGHSRTYSERLSDVADNHAILSNQLMGFSISLHNEIEFAKSIRKKLVSIHMISESPDKIINAGGVDYSENDVSRESKAANNSDNADSNGYNNLSFSSNFRDSNGDMKSDAAYNNMMQVNVLVDQIYSEIGQVDSEGSSQYSSDSDNGDDDTSAGGVAEVEANAKENKDLKGVDTDTAESTGAGTSDEGDVDRVDSGTLLERKSGEISPDDVEVSVNYRSNGKSPKVGLQWYPGKYIHKIYDHKRPRKHLAASNSVDDTSSKDSSSAISRWFKSRTKASNGEEQNKNDVHKPGNTSNSNNNNDKTTNFLGNRLRSESHPFNQTEQTNGDDSNNNDNNKHRNNNKNNSGSINNSNNNSNNKNNNKNVNKNSNIEDSEVEFDVNWVIESYDFDLFLSKLSRTPWFAPYILRNVEEMTLDDKEDLFCKELRLSQSVDTAYVNIVLAALPGRELEKLKNYAKAFYQSKMRTKSLMQTVQVLSSKLNSANDEIKLVQSKVAKSNDDKERLCHQLQALLRDARRDRQKNLQIISEIYTYPLYKCKIKDIGAVIIFQS